MEESKRADSNKEKEIVFSRTVKAGKRIYYIDVKRNRKDELYIAVTESKRITAGNDPVDMKVSFEKHKIFLYPEDFDKFRDNMNEAISYIEDIQGKVEARPEADGSEIKINLDF